MSEKEYNAIIKPNEERLIKLQKALWVIESVSNDGVEIEQGTAFVLSGSKYLITARHCIIGEDIKGSRPSVSTFQFELKVHKIFDDLDIAILKFEDRNMKLESLNYSNSEKLQTLDSLLICGYPNYNGIDLAHIIPSSLSSRTKLFNVNHLSLSHGIVTGNSGGPILNDKFEVVGVAVRGSDNLSSNTNKNLAVPIETVLRATSDLFEH
jgi:S1-C subfamily serine protease